MNRTETEIGIVLEVRPGRARVEVSPSGMCSNCELSSTCIPGSGGTRIIEVADPLGVSIDQKVQIELGSNKLILASFMAYIVPLVFMLAGTIAGFYTADYGASELWGGIGAFGGLAVGLLISRMLAQYLKSRGQLNPTITAVVAADEKEEPKDVDQKFFHPGNDL